MEVGTVRNHFVLCVLQSVVSAALRAVGNIVTGDDIQTQVGILTACPPPPTPRHLI